MFGGYEDVEVFEDALYQGTSRSSSESDVDSEAEFNLYGLMHYAQDLGIYEKPEDSDKTEGSEQVKKQGHTSNDFTCSINSSQSSKKSPFMFHKPDIICLDSEDSSAIVIDSDTSVIMYVSEKEISTVEDVTCKEKVAPIPEECSKEFGDQNVHLTEPLDTSKEQNEVVHATKKKKPRREKRVAGDKGKCLKAGKRVQQSDVALELQSSDEDSSSVHSWMLLDDEYESDNKDIWLNVVSGGNNFGKWAMNNRDLQACIVNQKRAAVKGAQSKGRLHKKNSRPYDWCNKQKPHFQARHQGRKHPQCNICGNLGHLRVTCPFLPCYLCRCPGHLAQDCIEGPTNSQCRRCRMMGHFVDDCPDIWRQFHLTTQCGPIIQGAAYNYCQEQPKFCYNCAGCGHFGHECHRKRMGNGIFPTTPFVCHYDHNREIWERDMRSEKRSLELQKRGMLNSSMVNLTIQQCLDDTDDFCRNTPKRARKGQHWKNGQHNSKPYWLFHKRFERGQKTEGRPTSTGFVRNGPKKLLGQRRSRRDHTSEAAARLRNQKWHPTTYAAPVGREPKGKRPKPTVKKKKKAKNNVSPTTCVPLRGKGRKINRRGKGGFVDYIQ